MDDGLLNWLASVSDDPHAFVLGAFPWGEESTSLEKFAGPEQWQIDILSIIRDKLRAKEINATDAVQLAVMLAVASGHGIGKSALVSWIILWGISTFADTRGVVTANTETQLKTKTWAELGKWYHLFIGKEAFELTATAIFSNDPAHERTWRIDMVPWNENNPEAFAGLHNQGRRIILLFDEASKIHDKIWEVAEGALTDADTQIIWCVFGNPTRNTGRFKECFLGGLFSKLWTTRQIDSRSVSFTNKTQFKAWSDAYGDDSDFFRIRVRGIFPRAGEMEFIPADDIEAAAEREVTGHLHEPLCLGVDVARYGSNETVLCFRKGRDARSIPPIRLRAANTVEVAARIQQAYDTYHVDAIFIDGGGVGGGVVDNVRALHLHCFDVQFGGKADLGGFSTGNDGEKYANKRAEMWGAMRQWLKTGGIENTPDLKAQLVGPTYTYNLSGAILLEKKEDMMKRGVDSPDYGDALALTFAYPVAKHELAGGDHPHKPLVQSDYDPYSDERMVA